MPDNPSLPDVQARLHEVATLLRDNQALDDSSRKTLAELVDELGRILQSGQVPPSEVAHLAETTAHLAESLHQQRDRTYMGTVRDRFEQAVLIVEAKAPFVSGLAHRLSDALANLGI